MKRFTLDLDHPSHGDADFAERRHADPPHQDADLPYLDAEVPGAFTRIVEGVDRIAKIPLGNRASAAP